MMAFNKTRRGRFIAPIADVSALAAIHDIPFHSLTFIIVHNADYVVSQNKMDFESGPSTVTLSRSEGSVALGTEMLRCGSA